MGQDMVKGGEPPPKKKAAKKKAAKKGAKKKAGKKKQRRVTPCEFPTQDREDEQSVVHFSRSSVLTCVIEILR